jgi:hypothetical protein
VPAGTRNHFALDLGVDRDDVGGALDAFVDGRERCVDLAEVNGRVFVNNVSLGLYADAVERKGYRDAKLRTLLDAVPDGRLYLFSQAPGWTAADQPRRFGAELGRVLEHEGFVLEEVMVKDFGTAFATGVVARASR